MSRPVKTPSPDTPPSPEPAKTAPLLNWQKCLQDIVKTVGVETPEHVVTNRVKLLRFIYPKDAVLAMKANGVGHWQKNIKDNIQFYQDKLVNGCVEMGTWLMKDNSRDTCLDMDANLSIAAKMQVAEEYHRVLKPGKPAIMEVPQDPHNPDVFHGATQVIYGMMQSLGFDMRDDAIRPFDGGCYVVGLKPQHHAQQIAVNPPAASRKPLKR